MAKYIEDIDGKAIHVYSDDGRFLYSYNRDYPEMRFGIEREKTIYGYKFTETDNGWSIVYVGRDDKCN